jgi:aminoglycoside 6'-N-acetyltransferase I
MFLSSDLTGRRPVANANFSAPIVAPLRIAGNPPLWSSCAARRGVACCLLTGAPAGRPGKGRVMLDLKIEPCISVEQAGWLAMREALWPDTTRGEHLAEMAAFLRDGQRYAQYVAYTEEGEPAGFAEASLRTDYVSGATTSPVGYLEGLYVAPQYRRRGVGSALVRAVEEWSAAQGCRELASDTQLDNLESQATHQALGFSEVERLVAFCKPLPRG